MDFHWIYRGKKRDFGSLDDYTLNVFVILKEALAFKFLVEELTHFYCIYIWEWALAYYDWF